MERPLKIKTPEEMEQLWEDYQHIEGFFNVNISLKKYYNRNNLDKI